MKLYYCEVNWYDDYREKSDTDTCFIFAPTYADACGQLDAHFSYIEKLTIEEVCADTANTTILFLGGKNEDLVQSIKDSNCY